MILGIFLRKNIYIKMFHLLCVYVYHLRQLRPVLRSLTHEAARTLVQAFISSRLDYCNSLLYGVSQSLILKVQSVQNAAARLLTRTYLASFASVALAPCPETCRLQTGMLCLLVVVRQGTSVLGRRHTLGLRRS